MRICYKAEDGVVFYKKKDCFEYEELLKRAQNAVKDIKFREVKEGWNNDPDPIKFHDKEEVWKAWSEFLSVVKDLVTWCGMYRDYKSYETDEPRDIESTLLEQLERYSTEHRNVYPISLTSEGWYGFDAIRRKFEAVNFENGEEYVGSFGTRGMEGRKSYLEMIEG